MIWTVTPSTFKRQAGGYASKVMIGGSAAQKIAVWGAAPVVEPSGAAQAAVTLGNTDEEIGGLTPSEPKGGRTYCTGTTWPSPGSRY
jgi:hypothetical protein